MEDITLDAPADGTLQLTMAFLNRNVRNALRLILSPPTALLAKTGTQTLVPFGSYLVLSWDTKLADTEDPATPIWSAGSPTRLTCRTSGWYEATACVPAIIAANNSLTVLFRKNGSAAQMYGADTAPATNSAPVEQVNFCTLIPMTAGDYLEVLVATSMATSLPSTGVNYGAPRVAFRRIRGL